MRAVVQRVAGASVRVGQRIAGEIESGLLVLLGIGVGDGEGDAVRMARKIAGLRIFPDGENAMNRSICDTAGSVLLVSQFTLYGDARRGRRPSFASAAKSEHARRLYDRVGAELASAGLGVAYGEFGADMDVASINRGPVTILLDSGGDF